MASFNNEINTKTTTTYIGYNNKKNAITNIVQQKNHKTMAMA